jgi:hypothetical protein
MIICEVCGNEIPASSRRCVFCGSYQSSRRTSPRRSSPIRNVNLEEGMPPVKEGLERLEEALRCARHEGVRILRVIHGYGSSGSGGKLRIACRAFLKQKVSSRQIRGFLPGEEYSGAGGAGRVLIRRHPSLSRTEHMDRGNPGITFVEL